MPDIFGVKDKAVAIRLQNVLVSYFSYAPLCSFPLSSSVNDHTGHYDGLTVHTSNPRLIQISDMHFLMLALIQ